MNLNSESKFFLSVGAITIAIIIAGLFIFSKPQTATTTQGPTLTKEQLITSNTPTKGNKDAAHYLVEFSDFECPACKAYKPTVDSLTSKYQDKLLFAYRHFPLDQHPFSIPAAQTAVAAQKQNKFWEMYDLLFANQETFSNDAFPKFAKDLSLNEDQFKKDFDAAKDFVLAERSFGLSINIDSTPTFFLDGKKLNLNNPSELNVKIDSLFQ
jgi:protein-disulfide isomerase